MSGLGLEAYAKINLSLDVLGNRSDGYHELRMIMQTISLHDTVMIKEIPEGIILECSNSWVPKDSANIAWKAASLMKDLYGIGSGIKINIIKRIPIAAGLAGGSTDAAAVLRGINELFSIGLDTDELRKLGKQLGADVPFCIRGGTSLAEGIGEKLTALDGFSGVDIVLIKPKKSVSTQWVYRKLDDCEINDSDRPDTGKLLQALAVRDIKGIASNMKNVLELVTIPKYEIIQEAKAKLTEMGALGSMMSGSGLTVFGIFPDSAAAVAAYGIMARDRRWQCFYTKTIGAMKKSFKGDA